MDAWLDAVNLGLTLAGVEQIADLDDDDSDAARTAKRILPSTRDALIRGHPWSFAKHYFSIPGVDAPASPYRYCYAYPGDPYFLRVWRVYSDEQWRRVGRAIYSDAAPPLTGEALVRVDNPTHWDADVLQLLALRVGQFVTPRLVNSRGQEVNFDQLYREREAIARSINAQERSTGSLDDRPESRFIASRY